MPNQPNFLVIMTDQHCYEQLACHGNSVLKTPNLDRLFARGTSINGMHTATPICMPNRQAFLTMRMNSVNGGHSNGVGLDLDSNTFPELLRASGYKTALIGKSHLQNVTEFEPFLQAEPVPDPASPNQVAPPADLANAYKSAPSYFGQAYMQERPIMWADADFEPKTPYYGFDEVILASGHQEVADFHHKRKLDAIDPAIAQKKGRQHALKASSHNPMTYATAISEEAYSTRFVGNQSVAWLERHADALRHAQEPAANSPFLLWCSIPDPHVPWTPPEKYYDMYSPADIVLPDSFYESSRTHTAGLRWAYNNELNNNRQPRMPFMTEEEEAKRIIATAYGMITFIDEVVGDLLATLEETGLADNTATVYEASGRQGIIDLPLIQVVQKSRVAGKARTVQCGQGDNVMVHACISHIQPGEIVVLAQPESQASALIGDMLVTQMETAGAAGVLSNGAVRDFEELQEMGVPIWTQFVRVRGATKTEIGRLNVPVAMGGNIIYPGDIVVMDADGAITVRPSRLDEILEKAEARGNRSPPPRKFFEGRIALLVKSCYNALY